MTLKPTPYEAFRDNIIDAEVLLSYALALKNNRTRGMRRELRDRVGEALRIRMRGRAELDCLESDDLFVVLKPDGSLSRSDFEDLRPLLRQSLVAACAALETYVADKAMDYVGTSLRSADIPPRMRDIPMTVGEWADIEDKYRRRGWGARSVVERYVREQSSTSPSSMGKIISAVGIQKWSKAVDEARGLSRGTTESQLETLTKRRNRIAHAADRDGRGRAAIQPDEVRKHLQAIKSVVDALETVFVDHGT